MAATTLGMSGLVRSSGPASATMTVEMSASGRWSRRSAQARIASGAMKGMSPWRLITTLWRPSGSSAPRAARMRSDPDGRSGSVRTARPPAASTAWTISASPAATATGPMPAASAWRRTRTIIGRPPMSARGLPGSRVAAIRAGMRRIGVMKLRPGAICAVARAPVACKRRQRNKGPGISGSAGPSVGLAGFGWRGFGPEKNRFRDDEQSEL